MGTGHSHSQDHAHAHAHADDHGHDPHDGHVHPHEHSHEHDGELSRGKGQGKVLFFDTFSGIAGDMAIASLLDLGVPLGVVEEAMRALPVEGYDLRVERVWRNAIGAIKFDVAVSGTQPERTWQSIDTMLAEAPLSERVRVLARKVFRCLGEAEAQVHRTPIEAVHFHEVGAVDSIVDVVGTCAMIAWLDPVEIVCSPLPLGHGTVRARHGVLPLPAPATILCLRGVPTYALDVEGETVTPTGAALVASLADRFVQWPAIVPEHVGWGAGTHAFGDRPNALRVVLGAAATSSPRATSPRTHAVIEANLDDMTGELAGHVIAVLMGEGALDVSVTQTITKKGRPGYLLTVLAREDHREVLAQAILRETTTIGLRWHEVQRSERPRSALTVATRYGEVPMKVCGGDGLPEQAKPEFDACVRLAETAKVPVRAVVAAAVGAWSALTVRLPAAP